MRRRYLVRLAVNLVNGSTLAGLAVAVLGRARLARCPDGLLAGTGYRLPVPAAPAFTMGNADGGYATRPPRWQHHGAIASAGDAPLSDLSR